jgi:hypothetical protein
MVTGGKEQNIISRPNPKAFVVPIFEIKKGHEQPKTKAELIPLLKNKTVIPFHAKYCPRCHAIPESEAWVKNPGKGKCDNKKIGKYFH